MEHRYVDIQAHIRHANQMRSDALGELISAGWKKFAQFVKSLMHFSTPAGEVAEADIIVLGS